MNYLIKIQSNRGTPQIELLEVMDSFDKCVTIAYDAIEGAYKAHKDNWITTEEESRTGFFKYNAMFRAELDNGKGFADFTLDIVVVESPPHFNPLPPPRIVNSLYDEVST